MQLSSQQSRKRAASSTPDANSLEPATHPISDQLKRSRTDDDDAVETVPAAKAWPIDIAGILSSPMLRKPLDSDLVPHDNFGRHIAGQSIYVICVQGACHLHYDLLWYAIALIS